MVDMMFLIFAELLEANCCTGAGPSQRLCTPSVQCSLCFDPVSEVLPKPFTISFLLAPRASSPHEVFPAALACLIQSLYVLGVL